jgi:acetyltransferase
MKLFLEPHSIALVGISGDTGPEARNILQNLLSRGYKGKLYPINPRCDEILGVRAYGSVSDLPETPDLALILTPRHLVPRLVKECIDKGIKAIAIVAQGFADSDEEGRRMQQEIIATARSAGARILGPNTFGVANAFINLNTAFVLTRMEKIPIGVICQTGFFFAGFPRMSVVGKALDVGNTSDVDFVDGLTYFEKDEDVKIVVLYVCRPSRSVTASSLISVSAYTA